MLPLLKRAHPHGVDAATVVFGKTSESDYGILVDGEQGIQTVVREIQSKITAG